ncbi:hypothetical protein MBM_03313 [Drepanopeziza brunnea f. sp. 'multigermtubi' MB_m1]|uniref:Uncharacterized protein n=1 Tax=Marssonina brunnea f. sp. multigermtubi (strain MB_m1) TaxID=1072389 RepID=K1WKU5_MARBU|nr:uncharacterized protein MBM_03313 [Drepanopeziza brunnea f. sp. 'multigermtubi' MB_m1]EKD18320.1 hypothetical protein MBM_03313 [Drepanopeziza brunnea f. sp. 'multigermtubi' MB_m1]
MALPPKFGVFADGRSGLTPIASKFPSIGFSSPLPPEAADNARYEEYQRRLLHGFTTRELSSMDVITTRPLKRSTLLNGIHPIFAKSRWEKTPSPEHERLNLYALPDWPGLSGDWIADNEIVWKAIYPSLQIATRVLASVHLLAWFAALLAPGKTKIPIERIHRGDFFDPAFVELDNMWSFTPKVPFDEALQSLTRQRLDRILENLMGSGELTFGFKHQSIDPWNNIPAWEFSQIGVTQLFNSRTVSIFLGYNLAEPLLRNDLSDAERMGCEWNFASVLLHEICHAVWYGYCLEYPGQLLEKNEPYFKNEPLAELGYVMEREVFGGVSGLMLRGTFLCPLGYWLSTEIISLDHCERTTQTILINPPLSNIQTYFPIKAEFFENIQQESFWRVSIGMLGMSGLHARTLAEGAQVTHSGLGPNNRVRGVAVKYLARIQEPDVRLSEFRRKLNEYFKASGHRMSLEELENFRFGKAMLDNAVWEEAFWLTSVTLRGFLSTVMDTLEYTLSGKNRAARADALDKIDAFLKAASAKHLSQINSFLALPHELRGQDRHDDLLRWNRGARIYARGCYSLAFSDIDYTKTAAFEQSILDLEFCRMLLYHPIMKSLVPGHQSETDCLSAANRLKDAGDIEAFKAAVAPTITSPDCSLFADAAVRVIQSELPLDQDTYTQATRGHGQKWFWIRLV